MNPVVRGFAAWAALSVAAMIGARLILGVLTIDMAMIAIVAALVILPPEWDPAIAMKEAREERQRRERLRAQGPWPPQHFNCRCTVVPVNASPHALPGETEADTIARLLKEARDK